MVLPSRDAAEKLLRQVPFGLRTEEEWRSIAEHLVGALGEFLGLRVEVVPGREPHPESFAPLIRCALPLNAALGIRLGGILSCASFAREGVTVEAKLFLFARRQRAAPGGASYLALRFRPEGGDRGSWEVLGWGTSEFPEEWDAYQFTRFFGVADFPG